MIMEPVKRKYPVGIQTFSEIIREGYLYVDKTDLVWQMTHYAKPYLTDGRKVVKVGIRFDADKHTVDEWEVEESQMDSL
jgi:hypothetical protein